MTRAVVSVRYLPYRSKRNLKPGEKSLSLLGIFSLSTHGLFAISTRLETTIHDVTFG